MIGKVGMTPAFNGYIIVPSVKRGSTDGIAVRKIDTNMINTIEKHESGDTIINAANYGDLFVPKKLAPTHNIVTAYAAAKDDLVTVDARA